MPALIDTIKAEIVTSKRLLERCHRNQAQTTALARRAPASVRSIVESAVEASQRSLIAAENDLAKREADLLHARALSCEDVVPLHTMGK